MKMLNNNIYTPYQFKHRNGLISTLIFTIIFFSVQFGFNTTVSVAILGLLIISRRINTLKIDHKSIIAFMAINILSLLNGIISSDYGNINLYQEARIIAAGMLLLILLASNTNIKIDEVIFVKLSTFIAFSSIIIQTYFYDIGIPLVVPNFFFSISDDGALAYTALQKANEIGYILSIRQSGFFSEPSYFGLILISINYVSLSIYGKNITSYWIFSLLLLASIISGTFYGQVGLILSLLIWSTNKKPNFAYKLTAIIAGAFLLILMLTLFQENIKMLERIDLILSGGDESYTTRFVKPFEIMAYNLINQPFGMPLSGAYNHYLQLGFYGANDDPPFHNALYNTFICYGYLGCIVVFSLFSKLKNRNEILYCIILMSQNGSLFSFDKIFILVFILTISRTSSNRAK